MTNYAPLTDREIKDQLNYLLASAKAGIVNREAIEILALHELLELRQRRCKTCRFFSYLEDEDWYLCEKGNGACDDFGPEWGCASWQRKDTAND